MEANMSVESGSDGCLYFEQAMLPGGWARDVRLTIRDGLLTGVTTGCAAPPGEHRHAVGMPGVSNLHSHAFQRGMAGLAERRGPESDSFWTWRKTMYRFVDRISPDQLRAIAALGYIEMLESGFTRVGEFHYLHHDCGGNAFPYLAEMGSAIVEAVAETGIGLTLLPVFYAHGGFGGTPAGIGQRRFINEIDGFARLVELTRTIVTPLPDAIVGVAPHSLRAVTPDELRLVEQVAGAGPIHIHIAEQVREVDDCLAWSGARPVQWLLDHMNVDSRWCLVHATHIDDTELSAMARSGAVVGLCPITEANLGDGIFPAAAFMEVGGRIGIGSDSNVRIDLSEELRLLEYGQRLTRRARNVLANDGSRSTGQTLYAAAVAGGAQAVGIVGGLAVGNAADIVSLDTDNASLIEREDSGLLDAFVFAAGKEAIDCVWRRGEKLVSGGRHRSREPVKARYRTVLRELLGQ
jgi:formimidoylglutamate deiminase